MLLPGAAGMDNAFMELLTLIFFNSLTGLPLVRVLSPQRLQIFPFLFHCSGGEAFLSSRILCVIAQGLSFLGRPGLREV